jgi:cell division septation protein DedD
MSPHSGPQNAKIAPVVAAQTQDDGFHEIQLNGKQLVFLFMAATVVSVVIFLCGVLVGRGVRAERGGADTTAAVATGAETTPQPPAAAPAPTPAGSDPTAAAPPPAVDELSYFNRLEKPNAPAEQLKPADKSAEKGPQKGPGKSDRPVEKSAKAAVPDERPAPPPPAPPSTKPASSASSPAPAARTPALAPADASQSDSGYAVQIAALNVRSEADAIARRLSSKGYAAYVLAPASGTPSVYRVRVGKFSTRREAESVAARLQKEEQFKPWITR